MAPSKKRRYFGTDGIRGRVGQFPMQPETLVKLAWAIGRVLAGQTLGGRILVGKDTRVSGYLLESAIEAGLSAAGVDTYLLGPLPTPSVAYLTQHMGCDAGIMISASHNPFYDNGLKIFNSAGYKLSDELELAIEAQMELSMQMVASEHLGKAYRVDDALIQYVNFCKQIFQEKLQANGMKIVLDCANGAGYYLAPRIFSEMGFQVIPIHHHPNGLNINDACGAVHPESLQAAVKTHQADLGIALDGDGDRVIMVDHTGAYIDGDTLLYIIAMHQHKKGLLKEQGVVGTQMTNLGLERAFGDLNIPFVRAGVGDRYVLAELQKHHWQLGGETSGHIIHLDYGTTGDGILSALLVLWALVEQELSLHAAASTLHKMPQSLLNVTLKRPITTQEKQRLDDLVEDGNQTLHEDGRILLRPSGTEPVLRIMVEGTDVTQVETLSKKLVERAKTILNGN